MSVQELERAILALDDPQDLVTLHEALNRALRRLIASNRIGNPQHAAHERLQAAKALHGSIRPVHGDVPSDDDVHRILAEARLAKHG